MRQPPICATDLGTEVYSISLVQVDAGSVHIEVTTTCSRGRVYEGSCWPYTSSKAAGGAIEIVERSFMTAALETVSNHRPSFREYLTSTF